MELSYEHLCTIGIDTQCFSIELLHTLKHRFIGLSVIVIRDDYNSPKAFIPAVNTQRVSGLELLCRFAHHLVGFSTAFLQQCQKMLLVTFGFLFASTPRS